MNAGKMHLGIQALGIRAIRILGALCFLCCSLQVVCAKPQKASANAADASDRDADLSSLTSELNRISTSLEKHPSPEQLSELKNSLPEEWSITTPTGHFAISSKALRDQLEAGSAEKARLWTENLARELHSYSLNQRAGEKNARSELDHILADSEFATVRPPTEWDMFRERIAAWFTRLLMRILGGLDRHPIGGQILFWVVVVACVGFVAMWIFRFVISRDRMEVLPPGRVTVPARTWQEWVREAREAASRGDFREAVHAAYWAGITRMESLGALPKDPSLTPREYLRLVSTPAPGELSPPVAYREPLSALTVRLERTWYANRGANVHDFQDVLRELEAMGCPLE